MITNEQLDKVIEVLGHCTDRLITWDTYPTWENDTVVLLTEIGNLRNELEAVRIMGKLGQNAKAQTMEDIALHAVRDEDEYFAHWRGGVNYVIQRKSDGETIHHISGDLEAVGVANLLNRETSALRARNSKLQQILDFAIVQAKAIHGDD